MVGTQATTIETFSSRLEGLLVLIEAEEVGHKHSQQAAADTDICFAFSVGLLKGGN